MRPRRVHRPPPRSPSPRAQAVRVTSRLIVHLLEARRCRALRAPPEASCCAARAASPWRPRRGHRFAQQEGKGRGPGDASALPRRDGASSHPSSRNASRSPHPTLMVPKEFPRGCFLLGGGGCKSSPPERPGVRVPREGLGKSCAGCYFPEDFSQARISGWVPWP